MKWLASRVAVWLYIRKPRLRADWEGGRSMDCIGLDLHKRESQLCILTETGEVIEQDTVPGQIGPLGSALEPAVWLR